VQVERFASSPVGRLVPISGEDARLGVTYRHYAFIPSAPPSWIDLAPKTYKLLSSADHALGLLAGKVDNIPNPRLLVRPALTKEAVATSALEGTYAPLEDVFEADYVEEHRKSPEIREVQNYLRAATQGLELIERLPICLQLIAQLQKTIVAGTRGESYDAGQLRERQVCIGDQGRPIEESRFVPSPPGDELKKGISDWEKWVNQEDDLPLLVKVALSHYQLETLHPFSDGNGRLGRLVITLQLICAGVLQQPILNLSPWLEPRRDQYIDHLLNVSTTGDFDPWVRFFAQAVEARANAAIQAIDDLLALRLEFIGRVKAAGGRGAIVELAQNLIGYPFLDVSAASEIVGTSYPTANAAVRRLVDLGILREVTGHTYGRIFRCEAVYRVVSRA